MPADPAPQRGWLHLSLNDASCGYLRAVEGGAIAATVVREILDDAPYDRKHVAAPRFEDLTLLADLSLSSDFYDWITSTWSGERARRDVTVAVVDQTQKARQVREFFNALISEVGFPALDGSSKNAAYIAVTIRPEYMRSTKAHVEAGPPSGPGQEKAWLESNFSLTIDGLDCAGVSRIDGFTVRRRVVADEIGDARAPGGRGKVDFPDLRITLQPRTAETWLDWHEDFLVRGNGGADREKTGLITFYAADMKTELATIDLLHLGVFRIADEPATSGDPIPRVVADLYCEQMQFRRSGE